MTRILSVSLLSVLWACAPAELGGLAEVDEGQAAGAEGTTSEADALAAANTVTLTAPGTLFVGQPATLSGTATGTVRRVALTVDGFDVTPTTDPSVVNGRFSAQYTFTQAGTARVLVANGLNSAGAVVATARRTIVVSPPVPASITLTSGTSFRVGVAATMSGTVAGNVASIVAAVDGFVLDGNGGDVVRVTNGAFSFPVTFTQAGASRQLVLTGRSSTGATVTQTTRTISVADTVVPTPRYFYQYNNRINPG
ncbi:MAG: hypothetical protein INH37_20175, partial [Myxococcaceae bacterium]|nr:hypothetical protein [Myxococcaceae bacterium]